MHCHIVGFVNDGARHGPEIQLGKMGSFPASKAGRHRDLMRAFEREPKTNCARRQRGKNWYSPRCGAGPSGLIGLLNMYSIKTGGDGICVLHKFDGIVASDGCQRFPLRVRQTVFVLHLIVKPGLRRE